MPHTSHQVAFLGYERIQMLDLAGPLESFQIANQITGKELYQTRIIAPGRHFTSESGIRVMADSKLDDSLPIDSLIIPGGAGSRDPKVKQAIVPWINKNFGRIPRVVSVCTGIFLVADLDYLKGKEVATHWAYCQQLQQENPQFKVNKERLFIQQGKFFSAAGVLSGIDLALNLIEMDHGVEIASQVARYLVTYLKRNGHQSQFSEPLKFQSFNNSHLQRINRWLNSNHKKTVSVRELAEQVHLSERHLNRLLQAHCQMSAAKYIEHIKLEQAKIYLAKPDTSVETTSHMVGYASADAFRRSFKRKYGIAPASYQKRFQ